MDTKTVSRAGVPRLRDPRLATSNFERQEFRCMGLVSFVIMETCCVPVRSLSVRIALYFHGSLLYLMVVQFMN